VLCAAKKYSFATYALKTVKAVLNARTESIESRILTIRHVFATIFITKIIKTFVNYVIIFRGVSSVIILINAIFVIVTNFGSLIIKHVSASRDIMITIVHSVFTVGYKAAMNVCRQIVVTCAILRQDLSLFHKLMITTRQSVTVDLFDIKMKIIALLVPLQ